MIPESRQQTRVASNADSSPSEATAVVLEVAVPVPLRHSFDYLNGKNMASPVAGSRVIVPFGKRQLVGVVLSAGARSALEPARLRRIIACMDETPLLDEATLDLLRWTADYYHHPIGEVIQTALPPALRKARPATNRERGWWLTPAGEDTAEDSLRRAPRQWQALNVIRHQPGISHRELLARGFASRVLSALAEQGLTEAHSLQPPAPLTQPEIPSAEAPTLTAEQHRACKALASDVDGYRCWLLEGVTGSGKTEVYLQRISACLAQQKQVLMLVPEIALTPQTLARIADRVGGRQVLALHSALAEGARAAAWRAAASGEPVVLIGTRSAIFTPLPALGLIIVDEEHDVSLKQQEGLRYSARDLAVWRANRGGVPIILGSATPSLESIHNAQNGRYQHLEMKHRVRSATLPDLRIENIRGQPLVAGMGIALRQRLRHHLEAGNQALLFLNRRGYAPVLYCDSCGKAVGCHACDVNLTVHLRARQLRCHHCGDCRPIPELCPDCREPTLVAVGAGTQRIEQELANLFPDKPVIRVDRDNTRDVADYSALYQRLSRPGPAILVGTQLLAKGHHFPDITLVGVLDIDQGLLSADFRAPERTGQLLSQVAGRAGRGAQAGEVIVQTRSPDTPLLQQLAGSGYGPFARQLLKERAEADLPPYSHLAKLSAEARETDSALQYLRATATALKPALQETGTELWGPVPSPMQRRAGYYRAQFILHNRSRKALHGALTALTGLLEQRRISRWNLDVDPADLY